MKNLHIASRLFYPVTSRLPELWGYCLPFVTSDSSLSSYAHFSLISFASFSYCDTLFSLLDFIVSMSAEYTFTSCIKLALSLSDLALTIFKKLFSLSSSRNFTSISNILNSYSFIIFVSCSTFSLLNRLFSSPTFLLFCLSSSKLFSHSFHCSL